MPPASRVRAPKGRLEGKAKMADVSAIDDKRPTRMVAVAFLLAATCLALMLEKFLAEDVFRLFRWNDASLIGEDWRVSTLVGYVIAAAVTIGCYVNPRINKLAYEVATELKKCTWPSAEDTRTSAIAVIVFSFVSAGILGAYDFVSSKIMTQWIPSALDAITRHI